MSRGIGSVSNSGRQTLAPLGTAPGQDPTTTNGLLARAKAISILDQAAFDDNPRIRANAIEALRYAPKEKLEKAVCPKCGQKANSKKQVKKFFGFRNMNNTIRRQSWCKRCRGLQI